MLGGQDYDSMEETGPRPAAGRGKAFWIVLLLAVGAAAAWGARHFAYEPDPAFAAEPDGKPVMLMFTADWCGPCQAFKANVLSNPAVLNRLGRSCGFRTVDLTNWTGATAARAKRYGVDGVPTLILCDSRGREISRYAGPHDPQSFGRWIDQNTRK